MKRSEVLIIVSQIVADMDGNPTNDIAEEILTKLEELGMKPPMCERGFDSDGLSSKIPPSNRWNEE